jgi:periplasmic mercuric ion binding protein
MNKLLAIAGALAMLAFPAWAAIQTVTLAVPDMTCAACPITVKKALTRVNGVTGVKVNYEKRQAVVTYDDTKTNIETLTRATADAGYPSTATEGAAK